MSPLTFLSWSKTFCLILLFVDQYEFLVLFRNVMVTSRALLATGRDSHDMTSKIASSIGQLLVTSLEVHKKKSTRTPWQMFHSLHFLLISCYLLWNKHGGSQKANRPPVKNTSICICHPLSHSIAKRLPDGCAFEREISTNGSLQRTKWKAHI